MVVCDLKFMLAVCLFVGCLFVCLLIVGRRCVPLLVGYVLLGVCGLLVLGMRVVCLFVVVRWWLFRVGCCWLFRCD